MTSFPPWFLVSPMKRTRTKWMHHVSWWNSIAFPTCVTRLCLYISNNRRSGRMPTTTTAKWLFPGLTLDPIRSCFWFGFWFEREFGQIFCYLVWGRRFRTECGGGMMMGGVENVFFFHGESPPVSSPRRSRCPSFSRCVRAETTVTIYAFLSRICCAYYLYERINGGESIKIVKSNGKRGIWHL